MKRKYLRMWDADGKGLVEYRRRTGDTDKILTFRKSYLSDSKFIIFHCLIYYNEMTCFWFCCCCFYTETDWNNKGVRNWGLEVQIWLSFDNGLIRKTSILDVCLIKTWSVLSTIHWMSQQHIRDDRTNKNVHKLR